MEFGDYQWMCYTPDYNHKTNVERSFATAAKFLECSEFYKLFPFVHKFPGRQPHSVQEVKMVGEERISDMTYPIDR